MTARRLVRVNQAFFDRLDELLPAERTDAGAPSTSDFLLHELPPIIDQLADEYERATLAVEGVAGVRVLVASGILVTALAVFAAEAPDGSIDVLYLDVEA